MTITQTILFFKWMSIINITILLLSTLLVIIFNEFIINIHSKLLDLPPSKVNEMAYNLLGEYKILIITFNIVPYFALLLI